VRRALALRLELVDGFDQYLVDGPAAITKTRDLLERERPAPE